MRPTVLIGAAATVAALCAGCGDDDDGASLSTVGPSEVAQDSGTITYSSIGAKADLDCANGKSLNVIGSNNTLTVTGTCTAVSVGGADNRLTVERIVKELNVLGLHITVTYREGDPAVTNTGDGNTITKR